MYDAWLAHWAIQPWPACRAIVASVMVLLAMLGCTPAAPPTPSGEARPVIAAARTESAPPIAEALGAERCLTGPAPQPLVSLRYGSLRSMSGAGVFIAAGRGYFQELGLDVMVEPFRSAPDLLPALASDQIEVGASAPNAGLYNALARGVPIKIIGEQGSSVPGREGYYAVVVRKDLWDHGEVRSLADLRGRTIAVTGVGGGGSFEIAINRVLQRAGLDPTDVNLVNLSFLDLNPALASGAVDLAVNIEPFLTQGQERDVFAVWLRPEDIWDSAHMEAVVMASPGLIARPEIANRFMVGYLKGVRDFLDAFWLGRGDKDSLIPLLAQHTGVTDPLLWHKLRPPWVDPNGRINVESLARDMEWNARAGYFRGELDVAAVVDPSFAACAVRELGAYPGS